jgi:hypothetical protein
MMQPTGLYFQLHLPDMITTETPSMRATMNIAHAVSRQVNGEGN